MKIQIVAESVGAVAAPQRVLRQIVKEGLAANGDYWHKNYRRRHFHVRAYTYYRYTPRKRGYDRYKRKKLGHTHPLVFTGVSRNLSEGKTIRATPDKVDVIMPTRAFNWKPKGSQVNMRDEFTQISRDEEQELDRRLEAFAVKQLQGKYTGRVRDKATGRFISKS